MNEPHLSIGPLMKAARKFKKFNQSDVAHAIGCSQSALSKMEHNILIPNAPQWFLFSRFTDIPPEAIELGVIYRNFRVKLNNNSVSTGFKLPKRYRSNRSQNIRELYPLFSYLEKIVGGKDFLQFLDKTGIDSDFFVDFDNLVNFQLVVDLINYFISLDIISESGIQNVINYGQDALYWNHFRDKWKVLDGPLTVLTAFAQEQSFFQVDFKIELEIGQNDLYLTYVPFPHVFHLLKDFGVETKKWLSTYRKLSLEDLITKTVGKKIEAREVPSRTNSSLENRFEIKIYS